jgi:hypothetical protein
MKIILTTLLILFAVDALADQANFNKLKTYKCVWTATRDVEKAFGFKNTRGTKVSEIIDNNLPAPDASTAVAIAASKIRGRMDTPGYFDSDIDCTSY